MIRPEDILYGYGPIGIGLVVVAYFAYKMFNILLADRDKAIADRDALLKDVFEKVLPAVARNTDVLQARQELDRDVIQALKDSNEILSEVSFVLRHGGTNQRAGGT